jgi:polyisoprenoid-binding protein YceI
MNIRVKAGRRNCQVSGARAANMTLFVSKEVVMSRSKWFLASLISACAVPGLVLADSYKIESDHTVPSFEVPHMGISIRRGLFTKTTGQVTLDRTAQTGKVEVEIDAATVDFGHAKLEEHVRSKDFLDVEKYPTIKYQGALKFANGAPASVDGQLTLHGVTKPVKLAVKSFNCIDHPFYKKEVCGAEVEGDFNRNDFGITKYGEGEGGKVLLRIQVEAIKEG